MMNDTGETINTLMYKVTHKDNQTIYTPHFPNELKAIDKTTVTLPGYLVPLNGGRDHETFMLSVLPIMQCMFCGQGEVPPMVEIRSEEHTSELQSLMRISYAVFCLKKTNLHPKKN